MTLSRSQLLSAAKGYCDAFVQKKGLDDIFSFYSHNVSLIEHGDKALVPFFGISYEGLDQIRSYYAAMAEFGVQNEAMSFSRYTVDTEERRVAAEGEATLFWSKTGERYTEIFVFLLDYDHEGKITRHQLWSDSGSAYLAKIGKLSEVREGAGDGTKLV